MDWDGEDESVAGASCAVDAGGEPPEGIATTNGVHVPVTVAVGKPHVATAVGQTPNSAVSTHRSASFHFYLSE